MLSTNCERFLEEDASHLLEEYKTTYNEVTNDLQIPNVLITGITGSGKSSFINTLFGSNLAKVGAGTPITQHFDRYAPTDQPIVIYDSKGLENGRACEFVQSTKSFFRDHADVRQTIHVVWYIINSAMARFQDFEKYICSSLFNQIPIIFVLNKADISSDEEREGVKNAIKSMNLENCYGIFDTVCAPACRRVIDFDVCPECGSEDILIRKIQKKMICENCGCKKSLIRSTGLGEVIKATLNLLPVLARESFISVQKVCFSTKEQHAKDIITDFAQQFDTTKVHQKSTLLKLTSRMLTRLSITWQFQEHGKMYGSDIAEHMIETLSFRDLFLLFLHKNKAQKDHAVALGILWNHCVRKLALKVFQEVERTNADCLRKKRSQKKLARSVTCDSHIGKRKKKSKKGTPKTKVNGSLRRAKMIHAAFEWLNTANLLKYEHRLATDGLDQVLDEEMPKRIGANAEEDVMSPTGFKYAESFLMRGSPSGSSSESGEGRSCISDDERPVSVSSLGSKSSSDDGFPSRKKSKSDKKDKSKKETVKMRRSSTKTVLTRKNLTSSKEHIRRGSTSAVEHDPHTPVSYAEKRLKKKTKTSKLANEK
eukprot:TRINITY_DN12307_c0_g1_i4.p1 TRINITY_DN12307_c0_g1~~TRINITY_DN12307_c0_g1_i4.p1  ORF type:complete len:596 (-),score=104.19 TRINITY_DN12307_c0_g1_i4:43-1830(-)